MTRLFSRKEMIQRLLVDEMLLTIYFQIRGKDLVGGIKVMPMGLDAAIKKRTSGEFKSEVSLQ